MAGPLWEPEINAYSVQMQLVAHKWMKLYFADIMDAQLSWAFIVDRPTLSVWLAARKVARDVACFRGDWFLYRLMMAGL